MIYRYKDRYIDIGIDIVLRRPRGLLWAPVLLVVDKGGTVGLWRFRGAIPGNNRICFGYGVSKDHIQMRILHSQ